MLNSKNTGIRRVVHLACILLTVVLALELKAAPEASEDPLPALLTSKKFDVFRLAEATNYFVELGEEKTVERFVELSKNSTVSGQPLGFDINERIGWLCRILYVANDEPIRQPFFGGLSLPPMPLEKWPLYPVAKSGNTYFVLSSGYSLGGRPEPVKSYIEHCQQQGTFRTEPIEVPPPMDATGNAESLKQSPRWQALVWKGESPGSSYFISEDWVWKKIAAQASQDDD